jgi:hypothetical protein
MYCGQCGKQIDDDSRFCRFCGATQTPIAAEPASASEATDHEPISPAWSPTPKKPNGNGKMIGIVAAIVLVIIVIASLGKPGTSPTSNTEAAADMLADNMEMQADNMDAMADAATTPTADATPTKTDSWSYTTDEDKVRGSTSYFATATSTNTVHQDPPYDSETTMRMTVRRMPSSGTDVVLTISSGQMMCPSYEGCSGTVRFDNGPARRITFNGPADSSSDTIFVVGAKSFIGNLKKAKKVIIEKTLYEAGNPQFEFDVTGLKWDH